MVNKIITQFYNCLLSLDIPDEIKDMVKQKYSELWCRTTLRTGLQCKFPPLEGTTKCKKHSGKGCAALLRTGVNKGKECGASIHGDGDLCTRHSKLTKASQETQTVNVVPIKKHKIHIIDDEEDEQEIQENVSKPVDNDEPEIQETNKIEKKEEKAESKPVEINSSEYVTNIVKVYEEFKEFPIHQDGCSAIIRNTGKRCGRKVHPETLTCKLHQSVSVEKPNLETFLPRHKWFKGQFWDLLLSDYKWKDLAETVETKGLEESDLIRDNDDIIDTNERLPRVVHKKCMYSDENLCTDTRFVTVCGAKVSEGFHFCSKHRKAESKMYCANIFDPESWRSAVERVRLINIAGYWQFAGLGLFSHLTSQGPIVVGKLWLGTYAEKLTQCKVSKNLSYRVLEKTQKMEIVDEYGGHDFFSDEDKKKHMKRFPYNNNPTEGEDEESLILRCHNNGLLYKILPQENLLYQYDITDLDKLPGKGFVSFEQMIRDRPKLYIKYWNVWNKHIEEAREWLTLKKCTPLQIWEKTGIAAWMNWEEIEEGLKFNGGYNLIIPPPSIEIIKREDFNPFRYCEEWVSINRPDEVHRPHYPPMYILYNFPDKEYQRRHKEFMASSLHDVVRYNPKTVEHYNYSVLTETPYTFMQALKFGNPEIYSTKSYEVPYRLRDRLGYEKWSDRRR